MKLKALLAVALVAAIVTGSTEIEKGVTVTLAGGDASIAIGAGAGIEVPRGAALTICGGRRSTVRHE